MKSRFVKIAALVLVAVLATSCVLSSTLAKYKTDAGETSYTAKVAKWEWNNSTVTYTGSLFLSEYTYVEGSDVHAKSTDTEKIVAPGTSGAISCTIKDAPTASNAPEVDYKYGWNVQITSSGNGVPANLKFGISPSVIGSTAAEFMKSVNKVTYAEAGTAPAISDTTLNIYWKWDFGETETDTAPTEESEITVTVSFTAEQIESFDEEDDDDEGL